LAASSRRAWLGRAAEQAQARGKADTLSPKRIAILAGTSDAEFRRIVAELKSGDVVLPDRTVKRKP